MKHGLIALKASQPFDASKALPTRLKLLNWGVNDSRYGRVIVNEVTLAALPVNQRNHKFDHVAIDFQHNSVPGTRFYQGEPVKLAARQAVPEVVEGEGLFLNAPDWIVDAETARNYVDLSACVKQDKDGNVIFLHSAALCRQGEVDGITLPLAADPFNNTLNTDKDSMDFKKLLIAILGLEETATDAEITAAAKEFGEKESAEDNKTLSASIELALKPLSAKIMDLETRDTVRERDSILALAAHDGKVIPASALPDATGKGGLDNKSLRALCAELPVTVPLEKRTTTGGPLHTLSADVTGGGGNSEKIRQAMGIPKERWDKKD